MCGVCTKFEVQADFYGLKKIPDENDIPPEYHFHPDYALYGVKFLSYFTQKKWLRAFG